MRASAALLGSLRSPRRAAEPQSGHFTCYKNRTLYLLPTSTALSLARANRIEQRPDWSEAADMEGPCQVEGLVCLS